MIYIVYQTTNKINNKIYIGVHKTSNLDFDGYIGCGVNINDSSSYKTPVTHFQYAVKKYGPTSFVRKTLKVFDTEIDALDLERWLVDESFVRRPDTYNMILGGGKLEQPNRKETYVYDKEGKFIGSFISRTDASEYIYGDRKHVGNISRAIQCGGFCKHYLVSNIKLPYMKNYTEYKTNVLKRIATTILEKYNSGNILKFSNPKKIAQYDMEGNLIKIWDSLNQCKKAGFTNVQGVVENRRSQCKGFVFKYYKD